ncbi:MAG: hypothetical protein FWG73_01605 [Planctomycetaceae bacterium]|nr:hypothetical protein [Planctomycetaceae bacterium]
MSVVDSADIAVFEAMQANANAQMGIGQSLSQMSVFNEDVERHSSSVPEESDPFYSESNLNYLRRGLTALNNGQGIERGMIEVPE